VRRRRRGRAAERPTPVSDAAGIKPEVSSDDVIIIPYNNLEAAKADPGRPTRELACVIVEPILGSVGFVPARAGVSHRLREEARRLGLVFILGRSAELRG